MLEGWKRGFKAARAAFRPGSFFAAGRQITCPHCGEHDFKDGSAQLNTAGMSLAGLDWLNKSAAILVCTNCGRIEWFLKRPERELPE